MDLGVIEGFYGRCWSWQQRRALIDFLADPPGNSLPDQYNQYWYAPKSDRNLRNDWQHNWPEDTFRELAALSDYCRELSIRFGVGLSPLGLYDLWHQDKGQAQQVLFDRLQQIKQLDITGLAVLFDDMQGNLPELAETQIEITHFVQANMRGKSILFCPSYYSFDPVLEEVFGEMPENYWQLLGDGLNAEVEVFWTGDKVISDAYPTESLRNITSRLQRKVTLWDNSVANDGRKVCAYIPVKALYQNEEMSEFCCARIINPMNQSLIAQLPLLSLLFTGDDEQRLQRAARCLHTEALVEDATFLRQKGRRQLTDNDFTYLRSRYNAGSALHQEVLQWLAGEFEFDPACLT